MEEIAAHFLVQNWLLPRWIDENYEEPVSLVDILTQIPSGTSQIQVRSVIEC
jgi:hypothetical protein